MLEIADVHFRYPGAGAAALTALSLCVARGEILGLLGPNGAGKSTLVALLSGLLKPDRGHITLNGEALAAARRRDPTRIAVAPQDYAFYPMLTVAENLRCFAAASRLKGDAAKRACAAAIATCQLERFAATRAERLSGGLKRRLNLAIALLPTPDLIVLDEPTVGVDPQSRAFLLQSVRALAAAGMAVIYTTHYMEEIESIADRVSIVDHGRVLCAGRLDDILADGESRLDLWLTAPLADAGPLAGAFRDNRTHLSMSLPAGQSPLAVLTQVEALGGTLREARFGRRNLEQVFMDLTHRTLKD